MRIARFGRIAAVLLAVIVVVVALTGCGSKVPNVVGMTADEAVRTLQDAGYKLGTTSRTYTPGLPPGQVFSQNPVAGDRLKEGEPVNIIRDIPAR